MLTFFRRIRKELLDMGAARKYLLYAVGEIALVVIGILIALQINNWNDSRKERLLEIEYFERLVEDLKVDTSALRKAIEETETRADYGKIVLTAYDLGRFLVSNADFARAIEYSMWFGYPAYSKSTYDELKSTGNLRLIKNETAKSILADYHARIEWTEQFSLNWRQVQQALEMLIPEILDLDHRNALFYESNNGPPWANTELEVSDENAALMLERLLDRPEARFVYANMSRIQGAHYTNLVSIYELANNALQTQERLLEILK